MTEGEGYTGIQALGGRRVMLIENDELDLRDVAASLKSWKQSYTGSIWKKRQESGDCIELLSYFKVMNFIFFLQGFYGTVALVANLSLSLIDSCVMWWISFIS